MRRVFITGTAGFIGFHLARHLLAEGFAVSGFDGMTDYYDVALKARRHAILREDPHFTATEAMLEDQAAFDAAIDAAAPQVIVHLAAQAGVRYSLENPRAYIEANVVGSFHVLEAARRHRVAHLMMASTSSVYGAETEMPYRETQKADTPMTVYAATKKAGETMAHAYAHLYDLPVTLFRFFTVYGPWGRPDMALYKFVAAILEGRPIDVYNRGEMYRDFTYVDDLVRAIRLLIDVVPVRPADPADIAPGGHAAPVPGGDNAPVPGDSLSPVAPHRIVNIGNSTSVRLSDMIAAIETVLGRPAERNLLPMQPGDVPATWADATLLQRLTGYCPQTDLEDGVRRFVDWYRDYHGV